MTNAPSPAVGVGTRDCYPDTRRGGDRDVIGSVIDVVTGAPVRNSVEIRVDPGQELGHVGVVAGSLFDLVMVCA